MGYVMTLEAAKGAIDTFARIPATSPEPELRDAAMQALKALHRECVRVQVTWRERLAPCPDELTQPSDRKLPPSDAAFCGIGLRGGNIWHRVRTS
jgi:hypothetical protein